jgi:hypothetical protein
VNRPWADYGLLRPAGVAARRCIREAKGTYEGAHMEDDLA